MAEDNRSLAGQTADALIAYIVDRGLEQGGAAGCDIQPGLLKVAGVPGIGNIAGLGGEIKQQAQFMVRIAAADAAHRLEVAAVHADQKVVGLVVRRLQQAGGFSVTSYPVLGQLAARWRVDGIAELLRTHSSGSDLRAAGQAGALQQVVHYELGHGAAADIAVAHE